MTGDPVPPRRRGSAFTEMLSIYLYLDNRFPIFEASAFLLFLCALIFSSISSLDPQSAFQYMAGPGGISLPGLILLVLVLKNVSSGWGGEFEKGTMQTFLTYPLSRGRLLLARLTSSFLLPLALVVASRFTVAYLVSPELIATQWPGLVVGFLCSISLPVLMTAVIALAIQWTRSGGAPFALGLVGYFAIFILSAFMASFGGYSGHPELVWAAFFLNPSYALAAYFQGPRCFLGCYNPAPTPDYAQATALLASNLLLSVGLIVLAGVLFVRRTEV